MTGSKASFFPACLFAGSSQHLTLLLLGTAALEHVCVLCPSSAAVICFLDHLSRLLALVVNNGFLSPRHALAVLNIRLSLY